MMSFEANRCHDREEEEDEKLPFVELESLDDPYDDRRDYTTSSTIRHSSQIYLLLRHIRVAQDAFVGRLALLQSYMQRHIELPEGTAPYNSSKIQMQQQQSLLVRLLAFLHRLFTFLLPTFITSRPAATGDSSIQTRQHPTAWLDGLRGLAALFVFIFHMSNNVFDMWHGYGSAVAPDHEYHSLLRLPIIKVFYAGPAAVSVFFVVSGFALSLKPLKQIRAAQSGPLLQTISSSVFRRPLRLFLPCYICSMVIVLLGRTGAYEATRAFAAQSDILTGKHKYHYRSSEYLGQDLWRWGTQAIGMWQVFDWNELIFFNEFDTHFWTIPVEFRASLVLFLTQVALARLRSWLRISITFVLIFRAVRVNRWEMVLFWGGAILAEWYLIANERKSSLDAAGELGSRTRTTRFRWTSYLVAGFWIANFVSSLYLIGYPDRDGASTPGFRWLASLIPNTYSQKQRFWQGMGGLQLVLCVSHFEPLRRFFMMPFIDYLGKISFALYLVHGTVNHLCGYALFVTVYKIVGHEPGFQKVAGFVIAAALNSACAFWVADVFWRAADIPCVKFGKWVEEKCVDRLWR